LGLKSKELARLIGKSPQVITRVEHGADNILLRDVIRLAQALQCSIHDLIDEADGGPPGKERRCRRQGRTIAQPS